MQLFKASFEDLNAVKEIADENRKELGFIVRQSLARSINRDELIIAKDDKLIGFLDYHHRRDCQTTIYHFAINKNYRGKGIAKELIKFLIIECKNKKKKYILLKCPEDLNANNVYPKLGFMKVGYEDGKRRNLIIWRLDTVLATGI